MIRYPQTGAQTIDPPFSARTQTDRPDWTRGIAPMSVVSNADGLAAPFWRTPQSNTDLPVSNAQLQGQGGLLALIGQMQNWISQLLASLRSMTTQNTCGTPTNPTSPEQQFQHVTLGSTGDPHLALDGSVAGQNGSSTTTSHHFDSMISHTDLMHSNDFTGGYQVSTTVGDANPNGVTTNDSARISLNNGNDTIGMAKDGSIQISSDGQAYTLANGQSMQLDGGETVTRNQDGSLTVSEQSASGGSFATTLKSWNGGVDVTASGQNVAIGGDIVNGIANPT